ncbi:MAG: hypothetical protein H0X25_05675 [Acidobacteriales bacterium]|nr:hypothetical protein [Terriglobales bacterium]
MRKKKLRTAISPSLDAIPSRSPVIIPLHFWLAAAVLLGAQCMAPAALSVGPPAILAENKKPKAYALIFGTVWGPDELPLYGVKIKIRRADESKSKWELYSDHQGEFAQRLPAGKADYVVWADLKGFHDRGRQLSAEEVKVHIDDAERVDIGLHLK